MKAFICGLSARQVIVSFGVLYGIALAMALVPWLYLGADRLTTVVLGMPLTIWYWLFNALLVLLIVWGLYYVEGVRGDFESKPMPTEGTGE